MNPSRAPETFQYVDRASLLQVPDPDGAIFIADHSSLPWRATGTDGEGDRQRSQAHPATEWGAGEDKKVREPSPPPQLADSQGRKGEAVCSGACVHVLDSRPRSWPAKAQEGAWEGA